MTMIYLKKVMKKLWFNVNDKISIVMSYLKMIYDLW